MLWVKQAIEMHYLDGTHKFENITHMCLCMQYMWVSSFDFKIEYLYYVIHFLFQEDPIRPASVSLLHLGSLQLYI